MTWGADLASEVAARLGPGWGVETPAVDSPIAILSHPDGRRIVMGDARERGRLSFTGCYPDGAWDITGGRYDRCEVTTGASRPPLAIARHISTQFMPRYTRELARVTGLLAAQASQARVRDHMLASLAAVAGLEPPPTGRPLELGHRGGQWRGRVSAGRGEAGVDLELFSVDPAAAAAILRILYG